MQCGLDTSLTQYRVRSEFARAAGTEEAHTATLKVMKGLAATAWRIATDEEFAKAAKDEYESKRKPKVSWYSGS